MVGGVAVPVTSPSCRRFQAFVLAFMLKPDTFRRKNADGSKGDKLPDLAIGENVEVPNHSSSSPVISLTPGYY